MRRPTPRETKALRYFMKGHIEEPGAFPGVGKKTWAAMVAEGWVEWVDAPATNEAGYRRTALGERAAFES
jgi:hypothetical protein